MSYELSASEPAFSLADRRTRYRKRQASQHPARKRSDTPSEPSERRAQNKDDDTRWQRILALSQSLSDQLPQDARATWLALEEALNSHWLDVSIEQYDRGVSAGRARHVTDLLAGPQATRQQRLRMLVGALASLVDEIAGSSDD